MTLLMMQLITMVFSWFLKQGITLKKASFTPYYYTYRYDKKN